MNFDFSAKAVAALCFMFFLAGCDEYEQINQWDSGIKMHALSPIYPPKTDFQVGDVYLMQGNLEEKLSKKNPPNSLYLNHLIKAETSEPPASAKDCKQSDDVHKEGSTLSEEITKQVNAYFKNRVLMPSVQRPEAFDISKEVATQKCVMQKKLKKKTTTDKETTSTDGKQAREKTTVDDITTEDVLGECPVVSDSESNKVSYTFEDALLPTITLKKVNSDVISAIFPINLLKFGLGFGWTSLKDVNVGFNDVKLVRIPSHIITNNINTQKEFDDTNYDESFFNELTGINKLENFFDIVDPENIRCYKDSGDYQNSRSVNCASITKASEGSAIKGVEFSIVIPYEVYYAKKFSVAMMDSRGNYFKGGVGLPIPQWNIQKTESTGKPVSKTKTTTTTNTVTREESTAASPAPMGMNELNALVYDNVERALAENAYGGKISSLNMSAQGIGYTGSFSAPIAIACKNLKYKVKIKKSKDKGKDIYTYKATVEGPAFGESQKPLNQKPPTS